MPDALTISDAITVFKIGRQVLGAKAVNGNKLKSLKLDPQLSPSNFAEVRAVLNGKDAKSALSIAIGAGNGIVSALTGLKSSAKLAGRDSLVSRITDLNISGTRVSRLNLHVDTNRALSLIDGLVAGSAFKNANFISRDSPNIRISTTNFGGSIDIAPQPLDTTSLDLAGISLLTNFDAEVSATRIETAINTARGRLDGLQALERAITTGNFSNQILSSLIIRLRGDGLPAGTLVDIVS